MPARKKQVSTLAKDTASFLKLLREAKVIDARQHRNLTKAYRDNDKLWNDLNKRVSKMERQK